MSYKDLEMGIREVIDSKYPINKRVECKFNNYRIRQIQRVRKYYYKEATKEHCGTQENSIIEEWLNEGN